MSVKPSFMQRVGSGMAWRARILSRYLFLLASFRNGFSLALAYGRKQPVDRAVRWNGTLLLHPPEKTGLVETLVEVWHERVYTGTFYSPRAGDFVIDAGANIGLFAIWIATLEPSCRVLAFEPSEENFQLLRRNLAAAGATSVTAVRAGLSAARGFARMDETGTRSLDHRLVPSASDRDAADNTEVLSFSDALKLSRAEMIDLFKIDIEGSERDLLSGASDEDLRRVRQFAIEYHDNIRAGTLAFLLSRLKSTHEIEQVVANPAGYGMLYARLKPNQ